MKKKVLMVDDDPRLLQLVAATLGNDYQLLEASNGPIALEIARDQKPDLILLDVRMPGMSGLEVCRRLKNDSATEAIKVVILTALGGEENLALGMSAGADAYFAKPFSPRALLDKVSEMLE